MTFLTVCSKMALRGSTSRHCYAVGCTNGDYKLLKWKQKMCEVHKVYYDSPLCSCSPPFILFTFPMEKKNPDGRKLWIKALCRATSKQNPNYMELKRDHRVCSDHFVDGKPSDAHPYPELNLGHDIKKCMSIEETERGSRYQKRSNFSTRISDKFLGEPEDQANSNLTREDVSTEEESSVTVSDFKIKNEKSDEVSQDTENTYVKVKTEPSDDSTNDNVISKFSESDDETVDCSQYDVMSLKSEPKEVFQQINCELEGLSVKREAVSPEKGPSFIFFDFKMKEEKSDEVSEELENTYAKVKTEPSGDSTNDNIISKFSESDDETVDCSQHDVMSLKSEPKEELQQINCQLEGLSDPKTCRNNCLESSFLVIIL
ncbi:uncharacterized protein LOC143230776 isoform X2 [Tachypleus tridentatus]|uniref:uncharacterized protein LOC143230776 isoform X2 n=2 Tax=Tachypleus tridentatus TaxID=6853 RepID=UPI003FD69A05